MFLSLYFINFFLEILEFDCWGLRRPIYESFGLRHWLLRVLLFFFEFFLQMIIWLSHFRFLVHCIVVCKFGHIIQGLSAVHATTGREPLPQKLLRLVNMRLHTQHRVTHSSFVLPALLGIGNVAEKTAGFLSWDFFLHHWSEISRLRFKFNRWKIKMI